MGYTIRAWILMVLIIALMGAVTYLIGVQVGIEVGKEDMLINMWSEKYQVVE